MSEPNGTPPPRAPEPAADPLAVASDTHAAPSPGAPAGAHPGAPASGHLDAPAVSPAGAHLGTAAPGQPGASTVLEPGGPVPVDPGGAAPVDPGGAAPVQPGAAAPVQPGAAALAHPDAPTVLEAGVPGVGQPGASPVPTSAPPWESAATPDGGTEKKPERIPFKTFKQQEHELKSIDGLADDAVALADFSWLPAAGFPLLLFLIKPLGLVFWTATVVGVAVVVAMNRRMVVAIADGTASGTEREKQRGLLIGRVLVFVLGVSVAFVSSQRTPEARAGIRVRSDVAAFDVDGTRFELPVPGTAIAELRPYHTEQALRVALAFNPGERPLREIYFDPWTGGAEHVQRIDMGGAELRYDLGIREHLSREDHMLLQGHWLSDNEEVRVLCVFHGNEYDMEDAVWCIDELRRLRLAD